jgi:peptidoglycan/LPS O-acetylase OafA/YrhL
MTRPDRQILSGLQVFRGLAAVIVILYHVNMQFLLFVPDALAPDEQGIAWTLHRMGFLGVDFFFVLSGFIIYHVHRRDWGNPGAWRLFLTKRFVRIQPLLGVIVAGKCAYLALMSPGKLEIGIVLRTLLCLPGTKLVGVSWTLTFEWLFYLVFSVAILFGGGALRRLCICWSGLILAAAVLSWSPQHPWARVLVSPYPLQFLAGVLVAAVFHRGVGAGRMRLPLGVCATILIACGLGLPPFSLTPREIAGVGQALAGRVYWGIAFALAVGWSITAEERFRARAWEPLVLTGNASYAIYLFHNETITFLLRIWEALHFVGRDHIVLCMWVFCILAFGVGLAVHLVVEKPLLRWGRDRLVRPLQLRRAPRDVQG